MHSLIPRKGALKPPSRRGFSLTAPQSCVGDYLTHFPCLRESTASRLPGSLNLSSDHSTDQRSYGISTCAVSLNSRLPRRVPPCLVAVLVAIRFGWCVGINRCFVDLVSVSARIICFLLNLRLQFCVLWLQACSVGLQPCCDGLRPLTLNVLQ